MDWRIAAVSSLRDLLHVTVLHIIIMATQCKEKHFSHGVNIYSRGGDNDPCCLAPKMVMVHGGSRGTKLASMHSLHDLLFTTVFDISGMATPGKGNHLFHGLYG